MGQMVDVDDLVDAVEVAAILGLSSPRAVYVYQDRYADMPRPAIDLGPNKARLWVRSEIEAWSSQRPAGRSGE